MARPVPSEPTASAIHGLWFVFDHAGQNFGLWVSALTGKEEVYLNGALVAERRKIALSSTHELEINGSRYTLALSTKALRRGAFECVLRADGTPVAALETEYIASPLNQ
jgi:hypothetical protein